MSAVHRQYPLLVLLAEPLTDAALEEAIGFVRSANPFAENVWGWDTGRFVDWRWGSNIRSEDGDPGWFSRNCTIYRDAGAIAALAVAEYGESAECIITADEAPEVVEHVLGDVVDRHRDRGIPLEFEIASSAGWLAAILESGGFTKAQDSACEWEYDLAAMELPPPRSDGFTVETLATKRLGDLEGIAECILLAFGGDRPPIDVLRSLEENPMFRPELSVFARSPEGVIAAYCRGTVDPTSGVAGIDPVCTHPDFQRLGLAKAVVLTCFATQRILGGRFSYIGSAPEPAPSTRLYRSLAPSRKIAFDSWAQGR